MSWPGGRWRRRSGTWTWRSGRRRRCRTAGAGSRGCCSGSSGCCWPASAGTCRRWPRRRSGCRPLAEAPEAAQPGLGEELRALALISLGGAEFWAAGSTEAERHLEQGVALARRIGRPYLEFTGLAYQAAIEFFRSFAAGGRAQQAGGRAGRTARLDRRAGRRRRLHDARTPCWRGRDGWRRQNPGSSAPSALIRAEAEPAAALAVRYVRGLLELARGRDADALAAFQAAERLAGRLAAPSLHGPRGRGRWLRCTPWCASARPSAPSRSWPNSATRTATAGRCASPLAVLRLAQDDPHAATAALAPVLDGSAPIPWPAWLVRGVPAGGDRPGRARRPGRRRARPGARARPGRTRRRAVAVPAAPRAGPARAPRPAAHRARRPDRRDPRPAGREQARAAARRAAAAAGAAERQRDAGAALPADQPVGAGDRHASCTSRRTRSRPTSATCTPSSARTAGPRPSTAPAPWACSPPPRPDTAIASVKKN